MTTLLCEEQQQRKRKTAGRNMHMCMEREREKDLWRRRACRGSDVAPPPVVGRSAFREVLSAHPYYPIYGTSIVRT